MSHVSTTFKAADFICKMSFDLQGMSLNAEWEPWPPTHASFKTHRERDSFLKVYRERRDEFMAEVSRVIGKDIFIAEQP